MDETKLQAYSMLVSLGVPVRNKGYRYILDAVRYSVGNYSSQIMITKDIYPFVAKMYRTTPLRVERSIRHAIYVAWDKGEIDLQQHIFGRSNPAKRPSNKEFISALTEQIVMLTG